MLSTVLGVLIAFITVILLLSMVVTGLVQATQAVLRLRSRNLQQGVATLLAKYADVDASKSVWRGRAAGVLNAPNLAVLEQVDKGDSTVRRVLGPKVSWAQPGELASAIAAAADSLRPGPESTADPGSIEQDVMRMEPALKKRFGLFIRIWTIFWSLIVAAVFQVNTPELLSSFAGQSAGAADTQKQATANTLVLARGAGSGEGAIGAAAPSTGEGAEAQLKAFGIRFWGGDTAYYFDSSKGLHWQAIIGVLVTGILMSFGAPFWFEKLQFLASLRDQKAPQAKSEK